MSDFDKTAKSSSDLANVPPKLDETSDIEPVFEGSHSPGSSSPMKKFVRLESKKFQMSKFRIGLSDNQNNNEEQSDANSSSNSATNKKDHLVIQQNPKNETKRIFPTLEEIEEFVPLSKILTYVENLKVQEGIKTLQNVTKSSKESFVHGQER